MRSVASLIAGGAMPVDRAVDVTLAVCRAYARTERDGRLRLHRVWLREDGTATVKLDRGSLLGRLLWRTAPLRFRIRDLLTRPNGPRIVVTRHEIMWDRMNVMALGTMLWELIAGERLLARGVGWGDEAPALAGVRPELGAILCKARAYDRDASYQTVAELATALEAYRDDARR